MVQLSDFVSVSVSVGVVENETQLGALRKAGLVVSSPISCCESVFPDLLTVVFVDAIAAERDDTAERPRPPSAWTEQQYCPAGSDPG